MATAGGAEKVLHFGSKTTATIEFYLSFEEGVNQYKLKLSPSNDDRLFPAEERVFYRSPHKRKVPFFARWLSELERLVQR